MPIDCLDCLLDRIAYSTLGAFFVQYQLSDDSVRQAVSGAIKTNLKVNYKPQVN